MAAKTKSTLDDDASSHEIRLDIWLWATRFFKTRSLAKKAIEGGKIRIEDREARASSAVRVGQRLAIVRGEEHFDISVTGLPAKRGSAKVAAENFSETEASRKARQEAAETRRMLRNGYEKPPTKPDKRARRLIKALGDIDMF